MKETAVSPSKTKPVPTAEKKVVSTVKAKAASSLKGKAVSLVKKKPVSTSKGKVTTTKNKAVSSAKKKPITMTKNKLELSNQVETSFKGKRIAYFVLHTKRTTKGAFIVCVAVEGEPGFYKMDWGWHSSFSKAMAETVLLNKKLGLNEEAVDKIIISTMEPPIKQQKKRR